MSIYPSSGSRNAVVAANPDPSAPRTGRETGKGSPGKRPATRERRIAPIRDITPLQDRLGDPAAVAAVPCAATTGSPTSDQSLGSDTHRRERPGLSGGSALAGDRPRAARRRAAALHTEQPTSPDTGHTPLSRAAVIRATASRGQEAERLADPERAPRDSRVDGERGPQSPAVCRPSAARLANAPAAVAVSARAGASTTGNAASAPNHHRLPLALTTSVAGNTAPASLSNRRDRSGMGSPRGRRQSGRPGDTRRALLHKGDKQ